jgi:SAM-dependent methyltransferase
MIFREQGLEGRGAFFRALGEELPFADRSFEVVICRVALPYMDNHRALSEIARVLRPGGKFFLKIHAPRFYWGMIKERAKTLNPKQLAYPLICLTAGTINRLRGQHPRGNFWKGKEVYQTRKSLARELTIRGLRIIKELPDTNDGTPSFLIEKG